MRELQQEFEEQHHPAIPPAPLHSHPKPQAMNQIDNEKMFMQKMNYDVTH